MGNKTSSNIVSDGLRLARLVIVQRILALALLLSDESLVPRAVEWAEAALKHWRS